MVNKKLDIVVNSEKRKRTTQENAKVMMFTFELLGTKLFVLSLFFTSYAHFYKHSVVCTQY